jgi:alcohol dehydrogenase
MRAAVFENFASPLEIREVENPEPRSGGVVIRVGATGLCRSDWHGWMGHDPDIALPHVPGHELAGTVEAIGREVSRWRPGDRVTLPFVCGCGDCPPCRSGNQQVCDNQFQPGFTQWGSFAECVAIDYADVNLVRLPDEMSFVTAATLGCRFVTAFRAVVAQGRVAENEWLIVHGCGGVGQSAIMIAAAFGARVIAVDIQQKKLDAAMDLGAEAIVNAAESHDVEAAVRELTGGGAQLSVDALGSSETCLNSIACLRKGGRHVQVGLMVGGDRSPALPMDRILSHELEIVGSHGMQAHKYPEIFEMIKEGRLRPERLVERTITLEESLTELATMDRNRGSGILVIDSF